MKLTPLAYMYIVSPPLLDIYMYCTSVAEHSFSVDVGLLHMSKFKTQNYRIFYNDNEPNMNNTDGIYEIERYHYNSAYLTNGHRNCWVSTLTNIFHLTSTQCTYATKKIVHTSA
jgi:hypothetical protein